MTYRVIVEQKVGKLPDLSWKSVFERSFDETGLVSVYHVCAVLHALFSTLPHRVVVISNFEN